MKKNIIKLLLSLLVLTVAIIGTINLGMESDMEKMLPKDSESIKASNDFNKYFDAQEQVLIIVTSKDNVTYNEKEFMKVYEAFICELAELLFEESYIDSILYKIDYSKLEGFEWAYLDTDLYEDIETALNANDISGINKILESIKSKETAFNDGDKFKYIINDDMTHYMMMIKPFLNLQDFINSRMDFYDGLNSHIADLLVDEEYAILDVGVTGGTFVQDLEADTVAFDGLFSTIVIVLALILMIVVLFFGSLKLPALAMYPLVLGSLIAAAIAYLIYSSINMFSISFALLLLGLGIDFAVHLIARYQEERERGGDINKSVKLSVKSTGASIIMGAITTAFAFAAFAFAKFKAFEQMGLISSIGIVSLCITMLLLMPALISIFDRKQKKKRTWQIKFTWLKKITEINLKLPLIPLIVIAVLFIVLFPSVSSVRIQSDILAVYPDDLPSIEWADEVEDAFDYDTNTLSVYADSEEQLLRLINTLEKREDVLRVESVYDYMPEDIEYKLGIINKLDLLYKSLGYDIFSDYTLRTMKYTDLPQSLQDNFVGTEGKLRAEIVPAVYIYSEGVYESLQKAISNELSRQPVGISAIMNEVTLLVQEDMVKISLICFTVVFLVAWIAFRKILLAILTIIPLAFTLYATLGVLPLLGIEINVFSVAAFPLIIGISIDSGIHLIHRLKENSELGVPDKVMFTGKAILLTALTTILGFGSLANINHPGMANLGLTVAIGMFLSLIFTLVLIPIGFNFQFKFKAKEKC